MDILNEETGKLPAVTSEAIGTIATAKDCMPPNNLNPSDSSKLPPLTNEVSVTSAKDSKPPGSINVQGDLQSNSLMSSLPSSSEASSHEPSSALSSSTSVNMHKTQSSHLGPNNHNNRNIHGKGNMSMESQYMQQQSQVFVFSTQLANNAADAVVNRFSPTIIAFHCSQPGTKKILEKHPLNEKQFKQNASSWLNNLAQMKHGGKQGVKGNGNMMNAPPTMSPSALNTQYPPPFRGTLNRPPCSGPCGHGPQDCGGPGGPPPGVSGPGPNANQGWQGGPDMCTDMGWQSSPGFHNNAPNMGPNMRLPNPMSGSRDCHPGPGMSPNVGQQPYNSNNQMCYPPHSSCGMPMSSSMPAGTKIPDENLTPQQRQHREERLAKLRKLELMFNSTESMDSINNAHGMMHQGNMRMPGPNHQMNDSCIQGMMDPSMCGMNSCMSGGMQESDHGGEHGNCNMNNPSSMMTSPCGMGPCPPNPSNMNQNPQMEWQKLQHQYLEDRRRKCPPQLSSGSSHPSPMSQSSSLNSPNPNVVPSPGKRMAGPPPPPYRQGPRPLSSPHPASPAASNSLSLPSPQMQSPADSSRQFSSSSSCRLPPYASPGPSTPLVDNSASSVSINSPKPGANPPMSSTTSGGASNTPISRTPTSECNVTPSNVTSRTSPSNNKKAPNTQGSSLSAENVKSEINSSVNSTGLINENKPSMHQLNCNSPDMCNVKNEPQLFPVPSPQQIQYLNTFDGQELTIQKQPNTSLRDQDLISPGGLDINFASDFNSQPQFPQQGMENGHRFVSPENNHNHRFPMMNMNMCGPHFDMPPNQRFMHPEGNMQRFSGMSYDHNRMPNSGMDPGNQPMRPQNMNCFPGPRSDGPRFPNAQDNFMNNRMRGPNPMEMGMPRYNSHMGENMQQPPMNPQGMHSMDQNQFNGPPHPHGNCVNQGPGGDGVSSTHLQNLQKMTPPFDIGPPPNKMDNMMNNNGQMMPSHANGPPSMHQGQGSGPGPQQMSQFDPIASMAAMTETSPSNPHTMTSGTMNMSSMQVAANTNGSHSGQMVNFHTSMASMHNAHQNMGSNGGNPNSNSGMHHGGMNSQMSHNMVGGPQTVNNTYVNATMSIQQLNIQNVTSPNYNSNVPMQPCMNNPPTGVNPMPSMPPGNMQMMPHNSSSPKLRMNSSPGPGMNPRTGSNNPQYPFPPQHQMNTPRGMNPMGYPGGGPNMGPRQNNPGYNSPNIQVRPNAPNTIQYLPNRPSGQQAQSNKPPNLDFLHRFTSPLTNLDSKVPTHNLQYFPNCGNMNNPQPNPSSNSNIPMSVGPGRPPMIRNSGNPPPPPPPPGMNTNQGPGCGPPMMPEMFNRQPNPNSGPHPGPPSMVPNSYPNMKPGGRAPGTMSPLGIPPDASQPLPPSVGHNYNYKQTPFYGNPAADPNYAVQFHNFQQQLYATNTRGNNSTNNGNRNQMPSNSNLPSNTNFFGPP